MPRLSTPSGLSVRLLTSASDYNDCMALQREVWGRSFRSVVPSPILKVANRTGGIAAGAFDGRSMVGFVFGLSGLDDGEPIHWSHMLAVRPSYRDQGVGARLKELQFSHLRKSRIRRVYWTFDPLVSRNAYLNLCKLGARVVSFEEDMYLGAEDDADDFGTDRFVVVMDLEGASTSPPPAPEDEAPIVNASGRRPELDAVPEAVRVEIPIDIESVRARSAELARRWRHSTREALDLLLGRGYRIRAFRAHPEDERAFYKLVAESTNGRSTARK